MLSPVFKLKIQEKVNFGNFFEKLDSLLSFPLPDFVEVILIVFYLDFVYSYKVSEI